MSAGRGQKEKVEKGSQQVIWATRAMALTSDKTLDKSCWWWRRGKDGMEENKDANVDVRRSGKNVADINDGILGPVHSISANAGSL